MADTTYRVLVDYNLETRGAEGGLERLNSLFDRLKSAATMAFSVLGLEKMIAKTIELGSQVENTRIQLAGMMTAGGAPGASDFNQSLRLSGLLIDELREKSLRIPGTWQDLAKIVNTITVPGLNAGKSMNDLSDLGAKAQSLFLPQGNDSGQIAHSLRAMLSGHARGQDPVFMLLSGAMKGTPGAKDFNAMGNVERYNEVLKALEKFDPAMKAFGNSWMAISTTTKNYAEMLYTTFSGGVFDALKGTLNDLNEWFAKNKETIEHFAHTFGEKLAAGLHKAFGIAKEVFKLIVEHKDIIMAVGGALLLNRVAGGVGRALGGQAGASAGGALTGYVMSAGQNKINTVMLTLEGAFSSLTGPVGLVAKGLLIFHSSLVKVATWIDGKQQKDIANTEEVHAIHKKIREYNNIGNTSAVLASTASMMSDKGVFKGDRWTGETLDREALSTYLKTAGIDPSAQREFTNLVEKAFASVSVKMFGPATPSPDDLLKGKLNQKGKVKNGGNTNINVKIEQTIENADDPERVMIKTREALDRFLIHPIETGSNVIAPLR